MNFSTYFHPQDQQETPLNNYYTFKDYKLDLSGNKDYDFSNMASQKLFYYHLRGSNLKIRTLILDSCNISSLDFFSFHKGTLRDLENLSLRHNSIQSIDQFEVLSFLKDKIRNLEVSRNPFMDIVTDQELKASFKALFPYIQTLNGQGLEDSNFVLHELNFPIDSLLNFAASPLYTNMSPQELSVYDTSWLYEVVVEFVKRFNELIESEDFEKLGQAYSETSSVMEVYFLHNLVLASGDTSAKTSGGNKAISKEEKAREYSSPYLSSPSLPSPMRAHFVKRGRREIAQWWKKARAIKHFADSMRLDVIVHSIEKTGEQVVFLLEVDYSLEMVKRKGDAAVKTVDRTFMLSICNESNEIAILNDLLVLGEKVDWSKEGPSSLKVLGADEERRLELRIHLEREVASRYEVERKRIENTHIETYVSEFGLEVKYAIDAYLVFGDDFSLFAEKMKSNKGYSK